MKLLYEGKAKRVWVSEEPGSKTGSEFLLEYKDDLTAFNALKKGSFQGKGDLNCRLAEKIYRFLESQGTPTHLISVEKPGWMRVRKLKMIPLEVVIRNFWAGSLSKRFGKPEGEALPEPLVEFYFKDDALSDPFLSEEQIRVLKLAPGAEVECLKKAALKVNHELKEVFAKARLKLVDFKTEWGFGEDGKLYLADEISPDSCRLWDMETGEKLDKDRFRRDLGGVDSAYQEVWRRLQEVLQ